jgi:hypothetical protein
MHKLSTIGDCAYKARLAALFGGRAFMLRVGTEAPDFSLESVAGRMMRLEEILAEGDHVLLIFLRHLG